MTKQRPWHGDPVARETPWQAMDGGHASFATHRTASMGANRLVLRPTREPLIWSGVIVALGLGLLGVASWVPQAKLLPPVAAAIFGIGVYLATQVRPFVFDRALGAYWQGWRSSPPRILASRGSGPLDRIHALQLLDHRADSDEEGWRMQLFQLNLVLDDGSRITLLDHGHTSAVCVDGERLADFLGVPLWDATSLVLEPGELPLPNAE